MLLSAFTFIPRNQPEPVGVFPIVAGGDKAFAFPNTSGGALITYYDHLSCTSLLPLYQQGIHAGSDAHKVISQAFN